MAQEVTDACAEAEQESESVRVPKAPNPTKLFLAKQDRLRKKAGKCLM